MEYPRLVYISPGANKCAGGSFDCEPVKDEKEHKAALAAGFSDSVPEALESREVVKESIEAKETAEAEPVRRGRPAKAKE